MPKRSVAWLLNFDFIGKNEGKVDSDFEEDDDGEKEEEDDDQFGMASMNPTNGVAVEETKEAALLLPKLDSNAKGSRLDPICIDFEENSVSSLSASITGNGAPTPCISPEQSTSRVSVNDQPDNKRRKLE